MSKTKINLDELTFEQLMEVAISNKDIKVNLGMVLILFREFEKRMIKTYDLKDVRNTK